jgi:hypothetical protein
MAADWRTLIAVVGVVAFAAAAFRASRMFLVG